MSVAGCIVNARDAHMSETLSGNDEFENWPQRPQTSTSRWLGSAIVAAAEAGLAQSRFGAVAVFFHVWNVHRDRSRPRFESQRASLISATSTPALRVFIETAFPFTRVEKPEVVRQAIPRAG